MATGEGADALRGSHPQPRRFGDRETNPARHLPSFRILPFLPSLLPDLQIVTHLPVAPPPQGIPTAPETFHAFGTRSMAPGVQVTSASAAAARDVSVE